MRELGESLSKKEKVSNMVGKEEFDYLMSAWLVANRQKIDDIISEHRDKNVNFKFNSLKNEERK